MQKLFAIGLAVLTLGTSMQANAQDTYVDGYYRNDGTYVAPHYRTNPNDSRLDNWSTQGNTNPYTGSMGNQPRPSLNPSGSENEFNHQPSTRNWNNNRPYGSSYTKPKSGM